MDHGLKGALTAPSSYFMKTPPVQYGDTEARNAVEDFIKANTQAPQVKKATRKPRAGK